MIGNRSTHNFGYVSQWAHNVETITDLPSLRSPSLLPSVPVPLQLPAINSDHFRKRTISLTLDSALVFSSILAAIPSIGATVLSPPSDTEPSVDADTVVSPASIDPSVDEARVLSAPSEGELSVEEATVLSITGSTVEEEPSAFSEEGVVDSTEK